MTEPRDRMLPVVIEIPSSVLSLFMRRIGFHGSGTASLELALGSLNLVFLYHHIIMKLIPPPWLRLRFEGSWLPYFVVTLYNSFESLSVDSHFVCEYGAEYIEIRFP